MHTEYPEQSNLVALTSLGADGLGDADAKEILCQTPDVALDGRKDDPEPVGDLLVAQSPFHEDEHLSTHVPSRAGSGSV